MGPLRHTSGVLFSACLFSAMLLAAQVQSNAGPTPNQGSRTASSDLTDWTLERVNRTFDALEAASKAIPRETFDPEAALELAGLDVKDVFRWVRDNTYLVPYQGALRGAVGVLMDRTGNSLDRALLLNALLRLLGYETRLARVQLPPAKAEELLAKARPIPPGGPLPKAATVDLTKEIERYAGAFGLDKGVLISQLEKTTREQERLRQAASERVAEQSTFLLEKVGPPPQPDATELHARLAARLRDHWWVQYQNGADWVSLDPTLPEAEPGQSLAEPAETRHVTTLNNLNEDLLHSVRVKTVVECWGDGALHETTLLESPRLRPAEVLGQSISLQHVPVNWPRNLNLPAAKDPEQALKDAALTQKTWAPALKIGARMVLDRAYTSDCAIEDAKKALNAAGKLGRALGGKLGRFGDALGTLDNTESEATSPPKKDGLVTAQWIEYELAVPGEPARTIRRQVFDLVGPAARKAGLSTPPTFTKDEDLAWRLALLGQTEILPLGAQPSPGYAEQAVAKGLIDHRRYVVGLVRALAEKDAEATTDQMKNAPAPPADDLLALAVARRSWSGTPRKTYLDRVNVLTRHTQVQAGNDGKLSLLRAYDIVNNEVGTTSTDGTAAFSERLRQGVLDTNAEALLAAAGCGGTSPGTCTSGANAAELQLASKEQGIVWRPIRNLSEVIGPGTALSPDDSARIAGAIENDYAIVAPSGPVTSAQGRAIAWWRTSPTTGSTLGMDSRGWGGAMTEELIIMSTLLSLDECLYSTVLAKPEEFWHNGYRTAAKCGIAAFGGALTAAAAGEAGMLWILASATASAGLGL